MKTPASFMENKVARCPGLSGQMFCNSYFCRGLEDYIQSNDPTEPVLIIAGEGEGIRTSPVL
jgi:hypothetical protein